MPGQQVSLVDMTLEHARQKLSGIVVVAYDSLDAVLRERLVVDRANAGELSVRYVKLAQASTLYAGTHSRGGSNAMLWISGWGTIQVDDAHRSEEILSGSLPSVGNGVCVIETTWKGGRTGHLWSLVKSALETPEDQNGPLDWRVVFFPWQDEPTYCDIEPRPLSEETRRYFADKPDISLGQQSWYQRKRAEQGMFMLREYPTTIEECFQSPVEGAIYAETVDRLRAEGAIGPWKLEHSALTHTCWDLGSPINTAVWYFQLGPMGEIRVIDCDMDLDLTPVERVSRMLAKGYLYGSHFLPHDAMQTMKSGRTFLNELQSAGLANCKAVPRIGDIWIGINRLKQMLPRFSFRLPHCERGIEMLSVYHTQRETSTGLARDEPVHDFSSHACDALRLIAEAEMAGMLASAGSTANIRRQPVTVIAGFRGDARDPEPSVLDRFFGPARGVRVVR